MTETRRNPNQRSYHLDEESVALLDAYAQRNALSQSAALRVLIRQVLGGGDVAPINQQSIAQLVEHNNRPVPGSAADVPPQPAPREPAPAGDIALPPDGQETFRVPEKFREKGGRPRPKHVDDDF